LSAARAGPVDRPPNLLIFIADDLGWRDVGYHGSEIRTPNLDTMARAGVRLERHYVCPTCSPTRAGLLTGRNPSRFGIHGPIDGRSLQALPGNVTTLAAALKTRGYATAMMGKWHLGLRPEVGPRRYGFDRSYGYFHGQLDQYAHRYKNGDRTWHRDDVFVDEQGHATDLIADEAIRYLQEPRRQPFFLWVAFSVPHYPIQEDARWVEPYEPAIADPSRRLYAASVTHMDAAIGRIVAALKQTGRLRDTVILFTSDNGGQRDYHSRTDYGGKYGPYPTLGDNRPLRGWKGELYEGGVRVPAFVSWEGKLNPTTVDRTTSYLDVFPTLARLGGVELEPTWRLDGRDIWPLLAGEAIPVPAPTLWWNTGGQAAVLQADWKLIITRRGPGSVELYDLAGDPTEARDLARERPQQVERLRAILAAQEPLDR
jgi:arylsulfatase A-like enzyme